MAQAQRKVQGRRVSVIGAGPNGLAAAIVLADAGAQVDVFEAESTIGGAVRTMGLTLPDFHHDFGSAVHPMAAGSPFFSRLPLHNFGLQWIHSPAVLAHPLDDGTAVILDRNLDDVERMLNVDGSGDGSAWRALMEPFAARWSDLAEDILQPMLRIPRHPFLLAKFSQDALPSATFVARRRFRGERVRALFAGLAAHSFLSLNAPMSASFGLVLGATAHAIGWPIPRGGAQSISDALAAHLAHLGGKVVTSRRIENLDQLEKCDLTMCDITPLQLLRVAGSRLSKNFRELLGKFRYGPGAFKVDFALSSPIPWRAIDCLRAATVHVGGSLGDIAASEAATASGRTAERPFVLVAQPTLFDASRAPAGKHIAWAYCHVPNGSGADMLDRIESQIERFAPGFRDCILARTISSPAKLESMDANLIGGDIVGGVADIRQFIFRPTWRQYRTSAEDIFLCSASTAPGGGVHGMCGYNAAQLALKSLTR